MATGKTALEILAAAEDWSLGEPTIVVLHGDEPFLAGRMLALLRDRLCPAGSPRGREPMASSNSRRLSSSTGSPISSRRRGNTGIATTECLRRITS